MIKFFRHIRQRLLSEGKTAKYFKYAIGEIILVVIGILIALQINNWNEERKADKSENKALVALKQEFEQNIQRLQHICSERDSALAARREYYDIITNNTISTKIKAEAYVSGFFGGNWAVENTVIKGLVNSGTIDNIKNDSLKTLLTLWPNQVQRWKYEEDKYNSFKEKLNDYQRTRVRRGIPTILNGKKQYTWKDSWEQHVSRKALFINDLEYQNFVAWEIQILFEQSVVCSRIMENYQQIITALNTEIRSRKIE